MKIKVVLLHGAMGSIQQWVALTEKLMPQIEVYSFNFSGHGSNTAEHEYSIDRFVSDTLDFLDRHQLDIVNFFGYSMGGYVALAFAKQYPERVNKIMTLGTKFNWTSESAAHEVSRMNPEIIETKIPQFAKELQERHRPNDWKMIMKKTATMMTELGNGKAIKPEDFETIQQQVLICVGSEDKMVTIEESQGVADRLKNGELMVIPGFKHPIETNNTDVLVKLNINFFGE